MKTTLVTFLRNWTLPVAMLTGVTLYFVFARTPWLAPLKPVVWTTVEWLTPALIFTQLLLTFCKIDPRGLKPVPWHAWLLAIQLTGCLSLALLLVYCPLDEVYRAVLEGAMVCFICPTATAAAVITGKLGGNAASLTTYTLLSNLLAALVVPLVFPWVEPHDGLSFVAASWKILSKVFPLLLCPFVVAMLLRRYFPAARQWVAGVSGAAFYLWAVALAIVCGQTVRSIVHSDAPALVQGLVALAALVACCLQFAWGKGIGGRYRERISGGQALGQKNTVLAIWMAYTYLTPLASVAPGAYVLWQNAINSWQLWKKQRQTSEPNKK